MKELRAAVLAHPQVVGVHDLIIHDYGPGRSLMSLHAEVRADADILAAHDAIDAIEREIKARFGIETTIHMDPIVTDDAHINQLRGRVARLVRTIHPDISIHDFRMTAGPRHTNLIFDMAVPHQCTLTDDAIAAAAARAVKELDPTFYTVVQIDRIYS